ncbi:sensor histidine kinase [Streptomyces sp. x-80]|uniref:sensor histidine kinase n=1 Tax=Streptomyces sp. x-80 TaxID=2789282 RepID=UPI003980F76E
MHVPRITACLRRTLGPRGRRRLPGVPQHPWPAGLSGICGAGGAARRRRTCDLGIALLVALAAYTQTREVWSTGPVDRPGASAAVAVAAAATLVLRRRLPEVCLAAGLAAGFVSDIRTPLMAAAYAVACYGGRARFAMVAVAAGMYPVTRQGVGTADTGGADLCYGVVLDLLLPAVLGGLVRHQRRRYDVLDERFARLEGAVDNAVRFALLEERTRLAFAVHDHVGHQATFLVLRAGALQRTPDLPPGAREAAAAVQESAQQVMTELRQLLEVLRDGDGRRDSPVGPTPCAEFLTGLVRNMTAVGMEAAFRVHGTPLTLPPASERLLYRICKEALTNVVKHAPGAAVAVDLSYAPEQVTLVIRNGPAAGPAPLRTSGRMGLRGLRLGVAEAGGHLVAGPRRDGGFRLTVVLPVTGEERPGGWPGKGTGR